MADSHIPDRARKLHPMIIPALQEARVDVILHAGDISSREVLSVLGRVAPVEAVRGNRDWFQLGSLPLVKRIELNGVVIALMHGHGGFINYLRDKAVYMREGYRLERYIPKLLDVIPDAKVVVFGHTHRSESMRIDGKLLFNPGSVNFGFGRSTPPSFGLLIILPDQSVDARIMPLKGYRLVSGEWQKTEDFHAKP